MAKTAKRLVCTLVFIAALVLCSASVMAADTIHYTGADGGTMFEGGNGYIIGQCMFVEGGEVEYSLATITKAASTIQNDDFGIYYFMNVGGGRWFNYVSDTPGTRLTADEIAALSFDINPVYVNNLPTTGGNDDDGDPTPAVNAVESFGVWSAAKATWTIAGELESTATLTLQDGWTVATIFSKPENAVTGLGTDTLKVAKGTGRFEAMVKLTRGNDEVAYIGVEKTTAMVDITIRNTFFGGQADATLIALDLQGIEAESVSIADAANAGNADNSNSQPGDGWNLALDGDVRSLILTIVTTGGDTITIEIRSENFGASNGLTTFAIDFTPVTPTKVTVTDVEHPANTDTAIAEIPGGGWNLALDGDVRSFILTYND